MGMCEGKRVAIDLRKDGIFTGVLSGMAAAACDTAAEKQFPFRTIENKVTGRFGAKAFGFFAVFIKRHMNAGNGFRDFA
jgi:hypothetical protein